ncbi:MAG: ABC transporter substrate-binding protein [Caldimonas sp.]
MHVWKPLVAFTLATLGASAAWAAEPLKIGLIVTLNGPFAGTGKQIEHGVKLYLATNGDTISGRKVEVVVKDDTPGTSGDVDKRLAQELVIKDKVDILAGFSLTPSAFAVAPIATEAKIPMVVMNAATSAITTKSPYIVRTSMTLPQISAPIATWAFKNGIRKVFILVADYGPGYDAEAQFKKTFTAAGGEIVGDVRAPLSNPDYSPFLERIKDAKPDAVFIFLPPSAGTIAFMNGFEQRGLAKAGIRLITTGDLTDEEILGAFGDAALGMITSFHYSQAHDSSENRAYVQAYEKAYPKDRPDFLSVGGYDGMALIAKVLAKTGGKTDGPDFVAAAKGMNWISPRGPITIDPATRDVVQTVYIRKVEKVNGLMQNVEFDKFENVKDPGKE